MTARQARNIREGSVKWIMRLVTYLIVAIVAYIILDIVIKGIPAINGEFLTGMPSKGGREGGILLPIVGTLLLIAGTIVVALPLGMASAIYLAEYARQNRFTKIIRLAIVTLAGVPSIVFGLFGLGLFVQFLRFGVSAWAGSFTLACMILPTIIVASEEALRAVPQGLREASLALGATKWQTIRKNVLPYSISGMITGSILGIGRAAGETAPILFTAAAGYMLTLPRGMGDQVMALPYHLFAVSVHFPRTEEVELMRYGTALVLITLVLSINLVAIILRIRARRKIRW
ncbi:phosphate ABC transporter permease PstA [candidate division WOR-3 bacterium]|uniref:Phosphate transport system permease protein PstA n=1 Tax=candidate division WOR-3 bacterium TaxID=2052148 RepID=A0A9D5QCM3_UNCW3|nr:phosphate ABC transporter permease PstA [candidate division WOR-3 bacterium]MBD3364136.1 phosphate ABC transporter permease PstA [candidate division WOR-3 bacterium]